MKKLVTLVLGIVLMLGVSGVAEAGYVNGYYKSNGTYVGGYYRSSPNAYKYDNYSYTGGSLYNTSYYYPTKNYSYSWYTPRYYTQGDYYKGLSSYNSKYRYYYGY